MNGRLLCLVLSLLVSVAVGRVNADESHPAGKHGEQEEEFTRWKVAVTQFFPWWNSKDQAPVVDGPRRYTTLLEQPWRPPSERRIGTARQFEEATRLELINHRRAMQKSLENADDPLR